MLPDGTGKGEGGSDGPVRVARVTAAGTWCRPVGPVRVARVTAASSNLGVYFQSGLIRVHLLLLFLFIFSTLLLLFLLFFLFFFFFLVQSGPIRADVRGSLAGGSSVRGDLRRGVAAAVGRNHGRSLRQAHLVQSSASRSLSECPGRYRICRLK